MLPDEIIKQLPSLHDQDSLPDEQLFAHARLTYAKAGYTWFVLAADTDEDVFSAYLIDPLLERFGYFSFTYMEEELGPTAIVFDEDFTPKPLVAAVIAERRARWKLGERQPIDPSIARHRAYYYAASFADEPTAAFSRIRELVLHQEEELSVFLLPPVQLQSWHIVVIGDRPSEPIHEHLLQTLSSGTLTTIPYDLLMMLFARKIEQNMKEAGHEMPMHVRVKLKKKRAKKNRRDPRHRGKHQ